MRACALVGAALLLLVDALPEGPGFVNTTSLNNWHHAQQSPVCSRNTSLISDRRHPPLINTVYYTGRSDSDLKHLTAMHGGATWPAQPSDIRWPSHYRFLYYDDDAMMKSMVELDPLESAEVVRVHTQEPSEHLRPGGLQGRRLALCHIVGLRRHLCGRQDAPRPGLGRVSEEGDDTRSIHSSTTARPFDFLY